MSNGTCDIGLIGLAVMGQNLVLNMNDHGYKVAVFNRTVSKVDDFINNEATGTQVVGAHSMAEFVQLLKPPRRVMLMVKAGDAVDKMIEDILPHLEKGDIIIDGGNSHWPDSTRRTKYLAEKGILFIGTGVSGGEEGARHGPSIMPGGNPAAWPHVKEIFQAIAAKVEDGTPCCDWVGEDGAGHYVKMVHNGIEYGDMQLICEAYQLMKDVLGLTPDELHEVFAEWNKGELDSYLIDITSQIFAKKDDDGTAHRRQNSRHRRAEGHGQVDLPQRAGPGHAGNPDRRSGVFPLPVRDQGGTRGRLGHSERAAPRHENARPREVCRGRSPRALLFQDHFLRAGLHAAARGRQGSKMEPELRRHRPDVAWRMHHSQPLPGQNQDSLRQESAA